MPSKSIAQQHLMQAAEHGADFPMAKKVRSSMSHKQMHDFAVGSEKGKPAHVAHHSPPKSYPTQILKGTSRDIQHENMKSLKNSGMSELEATKSAIKAAGKGHPNRHKNLGKWLHSKKSMGGPSAPVPAPSAPNKGKNLEIFGETEADNDGDE